MAAAAEAGGKIARAVGRAASHAELIIAIFLREKERHLYAFDTHQHVDEAVKGVGIRIRAVDLETAEPE